MLGETASLKASYNRTRQNLHLISNTASPTPLDLYAPSGPFFKPQTADQIALGLFKNFSNNEYEFSIEGYYKNFQNLIDFVDGADLFGNNFIETEVLQGDGRAYGLEFYLQKRSGKLNGWVSYTLSRTERQIDGVDGGPGISLGNWYPASFDKTHNLAVVALYQLNDRWSFSANFVLASGIPANYPIARYESAGLIVPEFSPIRNEQRLPIYNRLDLSARWDSRKKTGFRTAWVFGIYNVYNRQNAASIVFRSNADTPIQNEAVRLAFFGIVPSVSWEFKF
jgi:hypothetical protein